jgi:hypothetical protein
MIAGGLAAKAGGGSFEDGAVQAGMVHLYNAWFKVVEYAVKGLNAVNKARKIAAPVFKTTQEASKQAS